MKTKLFEVRDRATFIPMIAIKLQSESEQEHFLLSRAGFGGTNEQRERYVLLAGINGGTDKITCDIYDWGNRTRQVAHDFIIKNFDDLESGEVIDVEYILGETKDKKLSESITGFF